MVQPRAGPRLRDELILVIRRHRAQPYPRITIVCVMLHDNAQA
jgi:hypothetical protein